MEKDLLVINLMKNSLNVMIQKDEIDTLKMKYF